MSHHDHVVFESPDLSVVRVLEPVDELSVQGVSLDRLSLLKNNEDLVMRCPASEGCPLHIPRLLVLANDHVPVCLRLKHSDLSPGVAYDKCVSHHVEAHIHWLIRLILVLQVDQKEQAVLLYNQGKKGSHREIPEVGGVMKRRP